MSRLILVAVMWAAALLPLSTLAQVRGGTFRGPAVGPRVSPGFRPAGPVRSFGARPMAPSGGRVFVGRPIAPQGRVFVNRPLAPQGGRIFINRPLAPAHHSHSHVIFRTNPFVFNNCGGVLPCNPFFFAGNFFNAPFFPGSFFPGAWPYSYGYIPGFSSDLYYPQQQQAQPAVVTSDNSNDIQLAVQMQRLTDEVEQLRDEQARQAAARQPPAPGTSMSALPPEVLTTFVFRDGRRLTAQNYAIAGQTLWIFSEHTAKRISLTEIDLAATQQVNAANGVEIHLPEVHNQ